jgi:type IV pilus assembly protein PilM
MVREFAFPYLPEDNIHQAVTMEAQQVCPLDLSHSSMDYQVIAGHADEQAEKTNHGGTRGIFAVVSNNAIQHKAMIMKNASVKNAIMDVDGIALLNCIQACYILPKDKSTAVVDIGNSVTNVSVLGCDGTPFVRDIPHAGREIIQQIADELDMSAEDVEKSIRDNSDTAVSQPNVLESLRDICQTLITKIVETLRYYTMQDAAAPIEKIYLCGGFALVRDFVEMLQENLSEEVIVFNPFSEMKIDNATGDPQLFENYGPAMALSAGLAMRTV